MVDFNDPSSLSYEPPAKQRPVGIIAAIVTFVLLTIAGFWIAQEKKSDKAKQEVLTALDQELTTQEGAMKAQKERLIEISAQLESMKVGMEMGKKTTVAEYNKVAAQQRAERQIYTQMADEYNKKVAEYKKLEQ